MTSPPPPNKDNDSFGEHYIVSKIQGKSEPGNIITLLGYLGKPDSETSVKLYTNIEFNEYLEIKKSDIINIENVSDQVIEFGGTRIWIDIDSKVKHVNIKTSDMQAKFLKGRITKGFTKRRRHYDLQGIRRETRRNGATNIARPLTVQQELTIDLCTMVTCDYFVCPTTYPSGPRCTLLTCDYNWCGQ
ncbi:MAG: hypothetical protein AB7U98_01365 [Candidatus Nitrosocosmicus sp.]